MKVVIYYQEFLDKSDGESQFQSETFENDGGGPTLFKLQIFLISLFLSSLKTLWRKFGLVVYPVIFLSRP